MKRGLLIFSILFWMLCFIIVGGCGNNENPKAGANTGYDYKIKEIYSYDIVPVSENILKVALLPGNNFWWQEATIDKALKQINENYIILDVEFVGWSSMSTLTPYWIYVVVEER